MGKIGINGLPVLIKYGKGKRAFTAVNCFISLIQAGVNRLGDVFNITFLYNFLFYQFIGIDPVQRGPLSNLFVHLRLGKIGFVALIVSIAAITDHIDDNIFAELPAVIGSQLKHVHQGLRIFPMDVEDRRHEHFGDIGAIAGRPGIFGKSGIADLVVNHQMQGAAGAVTFQLRHVQGFGHNALSGKSGIPVDQKRQHLVQLLAGCDVLPGPGESFHHRIHRLQVAWIVH